MFVKLFDIYNLYKRAKTDYKKFKSIPKNDREIVFYAETRADWGFLDPVYNELIKTKKSIVRVTSDLNDKNLEEDNCFYVGNNSVRTIFFKLLDSKFLILTLTDLGTFYLKKSMYKVHYFYFFHSLNSTHVAYREHAFDNYSSIFCTGHYHYNELKVTERLNNLNKKKLLKCGYPKLDQLINDYNKYKFKEDKNKISTILIAPSWGENAISLDQLKIIINNLINNNYKIITRLHPMTLDTQPHIKKSLIKNYANRKNFIFDDKIDSNQSFLNSDCLISDWSGSAIEFAYCKLKPVIFINTPQKVRNHNWHKYKLNCFEKDIRNSIGYELELDKLADIKLLIEKINNEFFKWQKKIHVIRNQNVYNIGKSSIFAKTIILEKIREARD